MTLSTSAFMRRVNAGLAITIEQWRHKPTNRCMSVITERDGVCHLEGISCHCDVKREDLANTEVWERVR